MTLCKERFWSALLIIVIYLSLLISIYSDVNTHTVKGILECLGIRVTVR